MDRLTLPHQSLSRSTQRLCEVYDLVVNKHEITRIHPHLSKILLEQEGAV